MSYVDELNDMNNTQKKYGFEIVSLQSFFENTDDSFLGTSNRTALYNLIYIIKGKGRHEIDFVEYDIKADELLIISRNRAHRYIDYNNLEGYLITFTEGFLCEYLSNQNTEVKDFFKLSYLHPHIDHIELHAKLITTQLNTIRELYMNIYQIVDKNILALAFQTFVKLIVNSSIRENTTKYKKNELFLQFVELVEANINSEKTVEGYADMKHVSKKTVNQMTRKAIDMSAKQYIIQQLILKIQLKLSFEQRSIHELSDILGFTEPSNMTRFFKKNTGLSPREFRTKVRSSNNKWISDENIELTNVKQSIEKNVYHIPSEVIVPLHKHEDLVEIFYCIRGSGYGVLEDGEVELIVGQSFIVPSGTMHSLRSNDNLYVASILIPVIDN